MSRAIDMLAAPTHLAALLRSQYWSTERWQDYCRAAWRRTLGAAARIDFYRPRLAPRPSLEERAVVPILTRDELPALLASVKAHRPVDPRRLASSSGSTGAPITVAFDARHERGRFAAWARAFTAHGWHPFSRSAWIINMPESRQNSPLVWLFSRLGAHFLSQFTDDALQAAWLERIDPRSLVTLPSHLDLLLDRHAERGISLEALERVICGGELLEPSLRQRAEQTLGVPVIDMYGAVEATLAWQCPVGRYHINAEHVLLELLDEAGCPVPAGTPGRVVLTTLHNRLMPLVRYALGDYAVASSDRCPCGRTLPLLERIVGRSSSMFRAPDGSLYSPYQLLMELNALEIPVKLRLVQTHVNRIEVHYRAPHPLSSQQAARLRRVATEVVQGRAGIELVRADAPPRGRTGKLAVAESLVARRNDR